MGVRPRQWLCLSAWAYPVGQGVFNVGSYMAGGQDWSERIVAMPYVVRVLDSAVECDTASEAVALAKALGQQQQSKAINLFDTLNTVSGERIAALAARWLNPDISVAELAEEFQVSPQTLRSFARKNNWGSRTEAKQERNRRAAVLREELASVK